MASGRPRYSSAHKAGAGGRALPPGLAAQADADPLIDAAHDAGRSGVSYDDFAAANGVPAPAPPRAPRPRSPSRGKSSSGPRSPRIPPPTPTQPLAPLSAGGRRLTGSAAGVLVGAVCYALILSVIDYGSSGPKLWFKAKFLNQAAAAPAKAAA